MIHFSVIPLVVVAAGIVPISEEPGHRWHGKLDFSTPFAVLTVTQLNNFCVFLCLNLVFIYICVLSIMFKWEKPSMRWQGTRLTPAATAIVSHQPSPTTSVNKTQFDAATSEGNPNEGEPPYNNHYSTHIQGWILIGEGLDWAGRVLPGMYTMSFLKLASKMGNIAISLWSEGLTFWSVYANRKAQMVAEKEREVEEGEAQNMKIRNRTGNVRFFFSALVHTGLEYSVLYFSSPIFL
ncbi:hypothetical protein ACJX0J_007881 [Zea mays]